MYQYVPRKAILVKKKLKKFKRKTTIFKFGAALRNCLILYAKK